MKIRFVIATLILALLGNPMPVVSAAPAYSPGLSVDPSSGAPGITVTVYGSGYDPGGYKGYLFWDGVEQSSFLIPSGGNFAESFTIPFDAPTGKHLITVCASCGDGDVEQTSSVSFKVTSAKPSAAAPSIEYFYPDLTTLTQGACTNLYWKVLNGIEITLTGDFGTKIVEATDSIQICPTKTTEYKLNVEGDPSAKPSSVSDSNIITVLLTTPTTDPGIIVPPIIGTIPPVIIQPSECTNFDLGAGATVINFDSLGRSSRLNTLWVGGGFVYFVLGSSYVDSAPMGAHSGMNGVRSFYDDFGSSGHPISFSFPNGQSAVGLYVGREAPGVYDNEPVFAVLTAYGYDPSLTNLIEIASDQVLLPAEATPIQRCLVVRAPAGQGIRSVTLDYVTETGTSVYDRRWMDDLTFVGGVPIPDAPPIVTINYPANGSTITTDNVDIFVQVHEDRAINYITYTLNGGTRSSYMTYSQVIGADPTLYEARATIPAAQLNIDAINTIRVVATDSASQTASTSSSFQYAPANRGDIWITGVEVTQAIQTVDNRISLIGGKQTAVRVYVRSIEDIRGPWTGVMARLTVGGRTYVPSLVDPRVGIRVSPTGSNRNTTDDSFVFLLDPSDTTTGARDLTAIIYEIRGRVEANAANNTLSQRVTFNPPLSLSIYGVPYQNTNPTLGPAPWSDMDAHRLYTQTVFPVTSFSILRLPGDPLISFDNSTGESYIRAREWAGRMLASMPAGSRIYLLQPEDTCNCGYSSSARWMNGHNNHGISTGVVMAQEVAHNLGMWWHAAASHTAEDPNPSFPYFHDSIGAQVGFDTRTLQAISNTGGHVHDIMSYGSPPTWVSPYTYCSILLRLTTRFFCGTGASAFSPDVNPHAMFNNPFADFSNVDFKFGLRLQQKQDQFIYIAGQLNSDGTAFFSPFEVISSAENITNIPEGAVYQLILLDGSKNILSTHNFEPLVTHENHDEPLLFSLIIPYDPAVKIALLYKDKTLLAERTASSNSPKITLLAPNGGENWSGTQTLSWQAEDADKDTLTYTVEYSADNGVTWTPLNTELITSSLEVNFNNMPGSDNALMRVSASDGFNTSADQSDAVFIVPRKAPEVNLRQPADGATYLESVPFMASADAFDWEDGALVDPLTYSWSSDKDGALGSGSWVVLSTLTSGEHTLTTTVKDSHGNSASASVHVTIEAIGTTTSAVLPNWVWLAAGVGVVLFLIVAVVGFVYIWRRKK